MAKISDFGNTWGKFFCRGETHAAHLARHPSPLHGKNRANWHRLREIFSTCGSSSLFSPFTFKCPNSSFLETNFESFFKLLRTSINSHWLRPWIMSASPPVSGSILPASLLCENRSKWHHLQKIFSACESSSNVQNRAFWKPLSNIFSNCSARVSIVIDHPCESCRHYLLSAGPYCPLSLYVKIEAKRKLFLKFFLLPWSSWWIFALHSFM